MEKMRLARFLAKAGVAARRKCDDLIRGGVVEVNGMRGELTTLVDPSKDKVVVEGRLIRAERPVYILLNKPKGVIVTAEDDRGRRTIMDLVNVPERIFPVGRLDKDSEGLILLTNDGDFAQRILHPSFELEKEYEVVLNSILNEARKAKLERGLPIDGRPIKVKFIKIGEKKFRIIIHEGRKHIIRRMFERLGYRVLRLKRVRIGNIKLTSLEKGIWRHLTKNEVDSFLHGKV